MILTDIYVSALDKTYDFRVDETVPIYIVIAELVEIINREIRNEEKIDSESFDLCSYEFQGILPRDKTLGECHIRNGSKLFMI